MSELEAIGPPHGTTQRHHGIPFRGGGGKTGDEVGTARPRGHQRHTGLAGQPADGGGHEGGIRFVTHHYGVDGGVLQRIKYPVDLGPGMPNTCLTPCASRWRTTSSAPQAQC